MAVTLTCYGGVDEIGGNKILLENGDKRYMFDFGRSFPRYGKYFDGMFVNERVARGLLDPLSLEIIPPLRGLLRDDLLPALSPDQIAGGKLKPEAVEAFWQHWAVTNPSSFRDLRRNNAPALDALLISHAHQDHISDLEFVSSEIPAISTAMTAFISKVLLDVGSGKSGGPFQYPRSFDENGLLETPRNTAFATRAWKFLDTDPGGNAPPGNILDSAAAFWNRPASSRAFAPRPAPAIPNFNMRSWTVDHSIFGGVGFAVETEIGWVAYSGDIRFHGLLGAKTREFGEALGQLGISVLLCEGTRLTEPNHTTEAQVLDNCLQATQAAQGKLVVADFSPRNVERLQTFLNIAGQTNRLLLVQAKDAYLLRAMFLADNSIGDLLANPRLRVLSEPRATVSGAEKFVRDRYGAIIVGTGEIAHQPEDYILCFNLTDLTDVLDISLLMGRQPGGTYIFSNSAAYDEEAGADLVRLWNWTQNLGFKLVGLEPDRTSRGKVLSLKSQAGYHASGHAGQDDLVQFVRTAHPKTLVPIHTDAASKWNTLLRGSGISIHRPKYGVPIPLR